jgi:predicted benzoate:H+ symporter BenE
MSLCPLPVVMGMVCAVFLPFELKIITGFEDNFWIALAIVTAFIAASALPAVAKVAPPVLAALAAGIVAVIVAGLSPHFSRGVISRRTVVDWDGVPRRADG